MGYFTSDTAELSLPSDPKYKVVIKARAKGGDNARAMDAAFAIEDGPQALKYQAFGRALALSMLVSWNLTDDQDQPVPITAESLADLDARDYSFILEEAANRAALRPEEAEAPFVKASGRRSKGTT